MAKTSNESVKHFVSAIIDNKHKLANDLLKGIVNQKIKQKIINNNKSIF
jgi:hypothetical protein